MPRSGGNYTLPNPPIQNGATLDATPVQGNFADIATALSASVAKDGQTLPTANLPMAGFKHTGVGNATARTEYASAAQVQDSGLQWLASVSGTDTITATATPAITAYAAGQAFRFVAAGANTGAVTLNVNGVGAANVTKNGTTALVAGDIQSGAVVSVVYDGTQFQLVNVATVSASQIPAAESLLLGSIVRLATVNVTNVAGVEFGAVEGVDASKYKEYVLMIHKCAPATAATTPFVRLRVGASLLTTGYGSAGDSVPAGGALSSWSTTAGVPLSFNNQESVSGNANTHGSHCVFISDGTGDEKSVWSFGQQFNSTSQQENCRGSSRRNVSGDITGIQFIMGTAGALFNLSATLYGVRR